MRRKLFKKNIYFAISYIVLIGVIPATLIFTKFIGARLGEHIENTMRNSAELCAEMIERQYTADVLMLEGLSVRMAASFDDNPQNAINRLISTAERYNMRRIAFSYPDGTTLTTDGVYVNTKGYDNFESSLQGNVVLASKSLEEDDGLKASVYSLPVFHEETGEVMGVMSAIYASDVFEDVLSASSFGGEGYTYIVDGRGEVVINSHHANAIPGLENLFLYLAAEKNEDTLRNLQFSMKNNREGFVEFDRGLKKYDIFSYYKKLSFNDWYVFTMVPKTVAEHSKVMVMNSVLVFCILVCVISIYVIVSMRGSMKEKNNLLKEMLYVDPLTGGRSYEKFCIDCKERLRKQKNAAMAFLDIDNFNLVSTLYGHEASEETICRVYSMIVNCVGDKGIIGRNSADQFCVMYFYEDISDLEQNILAFVKMLRENAKYETMLRPSLGIYIIENPEESISDMLNKARTAHETVKQNAKTNFAYYDVGFRDMKFQNMHMEEEMETALRRHEFVPFLQPKYDSVTKEIVGAEALVRWINGEGNMIMPGKFIPLAENNGFIRKLDREMFMMVCDMQKDMLDHDISPVPISVNVSRQLLYDKTFADEYCDYVRKVGISPDLVELEITEGALFEDISLFRSTLEKLRNFGFRILMDDFGTGYSSLMMLHTVPIDIMKLDKSFIDDYEDEKGSSIIQCVLNLAKRLRLPVVAEGVETKEQYVYLRESGCEYIQGYYFSKPISKEEYIKRLAA